MDLTQAVQAAKTYFLQLYPTQPVYKLEEVEQVGEEAESFWLITLSYGEEPNPNSPFGLPVGFQSYNIRYKVFKIRESDGTVVSMKMRHALG